MRTRPTAGQATVEYVAALALIAALLVVAAPAVGAPNLGRIVVVKMRLALCIVAGDICVDDDARRAGLAPCPLSSDTKGSEKTGTVLIYEIGRKGTLTVTPQSDGSVSVVRVEAASDGATAGLHAGLKAGPIAFSIGVSGSVRQRVQSAAGWDFPDGASAARFLAHESVNQFDLKRFPPSWVSGDDTEEIGAFAGVSAGGGNSHTEVSAGLLGVALGAGGTLGGRANVKDGTVTVYGKASFNGLEFSVPALPSKTIGARNGTIEFTFGRDGPRELAFRTAVASNRGARLTEQVGRLDLRDPANWEAAKSLVGAPFPWPERVIDRINAVWQRMKTGGTVERTISDVDDDSRGVSGDLKIGGVSVGGGYKRIQIHKQLVDASAWVGGAERERFDCITDYS